MLFSGTQIAVLQNGLLNFQLGKRQDGKKMSWERIATRINEYEKTIPKIEVNIAEAEMYGPYDPEAWSAKLRGEALRRFAKGESELLLPKLELVRRFLVHVRMLDDTDLDDRQEGLRGLALLQESIANNTVEAYFATISKAAYHDFRFMKEKDGGYTEIVTLSFRLEGDEANPYLSVIEKVEQKMIRRATAKRMQEETRLKLTRRGFGFASTRHHLLHIFVNGTHVDGLVTYVQIGEIHQEGDQRFMWLLRSGEDMPGMVMYSDSGRATLLSNICYFHSVHD